MATTNVVSICNLALNRIGKKASVSSIDPPDGSDEALQCSRMYPMALETALNAYNWAFATKKAALAKLAAVDPTPWRFAYSLPTGCLRVIDIKPPEAAYPPRPEALMVFGDQPVPFEVMNVNSTLALLTSIENPVARYISRDVAVSTFSPAFVDALTWLLAGYLAGLTIRGETSFNYVSMCQRQYEALISKAARLDASQTRAPARRIPFAVRSRHGFR